MTSNIQNSNKQGFSSSSTQRTATLTPIDDKRPSDDKAKENNVICYKCLDRDHFARECKTKIVKKLEYYLKKMLFELHKEVGGDAIGQVFLAKDVHWLSYSENEELTSAHFADVCLMEKLEDPFNDEEEDDYEVSIVPNPVLLKGCHYQITNFSIN